MNFFKNVRGFGLLILILCFVLISTACGSSKTTEVSGGNSSQTTANKEGNSSEFPDEIPIGVVVGLSGPTAAYGEAIVTGAQLVVDRVNASGGIKSMGGAKIKLYIADHQSSPSVGASQTELMINQNKVLAILGNSASSVAQTTTSIAERYDVPMISGDQADELSQQGFKTYFRAGPPTSGFAQAGVLLARELADKTGYMPQKTVILADDGAFAESSVRAFQNFVPRAGFNLVDTIRYPMGTSDFTSIIQRLKSEGVDLIWQSATPPDGVLITETMKTLDYSPITIHASGAPYSPDYLDSLKTDADYVFTGIGFVPELVAAVEGFEELAREFEERGGKIIDDAGSLGILSAGIVVAALEQYQPTTPTEMREALEKLDLDVLDNPYIVRPGGVKFEGGENVKSRSIVFQIRDGVPRIVYPADVATIEPVWPIPAWSER